jgi:7-cyano-7-deazaguanine synthase
VESPKRRAAGPTVGVGLGIGSRANDPVADKRGMAKSHAMILHSGGLRSLVATALAIENDGSARLTLLHINDGRDTAHERLDHTHRQAEHFSIKRIHQLDLSHLYGHGQGHGPDGEPMGSLVVPQLLLAASSQARFLQAQTVIWPKSCEGQVKAIAQATEQAMLADQLGDIEQGGVPRILTPLLELTDRQLIELGAELEVPWNLSWSCQGSAEIPCRACPCCRRRKAAFQLAGVIDPVDRPIHAGA